MHFKSIYVYPCAFLFVMFIFTHSLAQDLLKESDVSKIMEQILSHHVDKKEMTGKVIQNALVVYIDQFDPNHMYLLKSEVEPFLHLGSDQLVELDKEYDKNNFKIFEQLNAVIQSSILRSRKVRGTLETENNPFPTTKNLMTAGLKVGNTGTFALTIEQLQERIKLHFDQYLLIQEKKYGKEIQQRKKETISQYEAKIMEVRKDYGRKVCG